MEIYRSTFRRAMLLAISHTEKDEKAMGYTRPSAFLATLKEMFDKTDEQLFSQKVSTIEIVD